MGTRAETGTGTEIGSKVVGREPERKSESLMRTGDRNRSCEREIGIADANEEIGIADANGEIGIADANGEIGIADGNGEIGIADGNGRPESLMRTGTGSGIGSKVVKRETRKN